MKNFTYYRPSTIAQAISLLENRWGNTELLAGGTDLLDLQKEYVAQPTRVVSLGGVEGFAGVRAAGNPPREVTIGAGTKIADIAADETLRRHFPALTAAAKELGSPQIRNMATLAGNLCQRNRCWYFRDEHVQCLLKGGTNCFAIDGENRYHAIFTQGRRCVIVNPSTLAPALIALGATATVRGPNGERNIALGEFFQAPARAGQREHVLAANEVVVSVTIPLRSLHNASYEVRHKAHHDWPLVQAAVAFNGGRNNAPATNVKVILGHVAPVPVDATAAARALENQRITVETATAAGRAAVQGARPLSQNGYKVRLVEVAVKRAALLAAGAQPYWEA